METQLNQEMLRKVLQEQFATRRLKNPAYSIRAFATKLGLSHSALSEILAGKRQVGSRLGQRLADSLLLDPDQRTDLFARVKKPTAKMAQLQADHYRLIADWFHFAILSLAETKTFKSEPEWIAKRLNITPTQAKDAINRLTRLKMMSKAPKTRKLTVTGQSFASSDGVTDLAIRKTHLQYLEMAQASLQRDAVNERDMTAITMAIDPAKIPEAKRRVRKFRDQLCAYLESGSKMEVFELCIQLFPLSKGG